MFDLLVIGGGINGTGIARDAAGRGLKVLLCEKDGLAEHTSSSSTKLIHGGLRYLEYYDFALVRKALLERETLLRAAPHIIWPMRFVLPHHKELRPAWLIRLGLFLYDHIGGRKTLPATKVLRRAKSDKFKPLEGRFNLAFEYSDCWVDDARLTVLNAVDAGEKGAEVVVETECVALKRDDESWTALLRDKSGKERTVAARTVVNAAGPWVDDVVDVAFEVEKRQRVRLVKGSHIIVKKIFSGEHAYFFQNADERIIFAIPYEDGNFTLIGTTDVPFTGDNNDVAISQDEIEYLCNAASEYLFDDIAPEDVVSTYSGVRPLYDDQSADASAVTRDYVLSLEAEGGAPILSVYGGKITTYRKLAEHALKILKPFLSSAEKPWTETACLPGGDMPNADFDAFFESQKQRYDWLPKEHLHRLLRTYGTRLEQVIGDAASLGDMGRDYGAGLYQKEVDYLRDYEYARKADDILYRRTKLGLHMTTDEVSTFKAEFSVTSKVK